MCLIPGLVDDCNLRRQPVVIVTGGAGHAGHASNVNVVQYQQQPPQAYQQQYQQYPPQNYPPSAAAYGRPPPSY